MAKTGEEVGFWVLGIHIGTGKPDVYKSELIWEIEKVGKKQWRRTKLGTPSVEAFNRRMEDVKKGMDAVDYAVLDGEQNMIRHKLTKADESKDVLQQYMSDNRIKIPKRLSMTECKVPLKYFKAYEEHLKATSEKKNKKPKSKRANEEGTDPSVVSAKRPKANASSIKAAGTAKPESSSANSKSNKASANKNFEAQDILSRHKRRGNGKEEAGGDQSVAGSSVSEKPENHKEAADAEDIIGSSGNVNGRTASPDINGVLVLSSANGKPAKPLNTSSADLQVTTVTTAPFPNILNDFAFDGLNIEIPVLLHQETQTELTMKDIFSLESRDAKQSTLLQEIAMNTKKIDEKVTKVSAAKIRPGKDGKCKLGSLQFAVELEEDFQNFELPEGEVYVGGGRSVPIKVLKEIDDEDGFNCKGIILFRFITGKSLKLYGLTERAKTSCKDPELELLTVPDHVPEAMKTILSAMTWTKAELNKFDHNMKRFFHTQPGELRTGRKQEPKLKSEKAAEKKTAAASNGKETGDGDSDEDDSSEEEGGDFNPNDHVHSDSDSD